MKDLTPEQIEKVCRAICKARKIDPDELTVVRNRVCVMWSTFVLEVLERVRALQVDAIIKDNIQD